MPGNYWTNNKRLEERDGLVMSNAFHIVDIIAVVALFLGVVQGYFRGLSGELSRLICLLTALYIGVRCHAPFTAWITGHTRVDPQ